MAQLLDLSHPVEHGMITYHDLPAPVISEFLSREASRAHYAEGTEFLIGRIDMVANTGTYVDAPFHRFENGSDLAELPLESVADLDAIVVRSADRRVAEAVFKDIDFRGKAVLIHTGWDRNWRNQEYWSGRHPFVTRDGAERLAAGGARLVGIDSCNIDDTADLTRPAHTLLLGAGIPICEHMTNLGALPASRFRMFAVPVKVRRMGSFPVRAFAVVR